MTWAAVPGADLYVVEWKTASQQYSSLQRRFVEPPAYVIGYNPSEGVYHPLENGTPYTVRMRVRTAGGSSEWTEITSTPGTPAPALPGAGAVGLGLLLLGAARRALRARGGRSDRGSGVRGERRDRARAVKRPVGTTSVGMD